MSSATTLQTKSIQSASARTIQAECGNHNFSSGLGCRLAILRPAFHCVLKGLTRSVLIIALSLAISAAPATGILDNHSQCIGQSNVPKKSNVQALFFTAVGCGPCHQMQPTVNHLIKNGFPIRPIEVGSSLELARRFRITATPTVVILKDGMEVRRQSGILNAHGFTSMLMQAGYQANQDVLTKPNITTSVTNWMDKASAKREMKRNHLLPTESVPNRDFTQAEKKAYQASVRIKIRYRSGNNLITDFGTGTVIHRHNNDILILTCGHIFRDSNGKAETLLELGFNNGRPTEVVKGQLLKFNAHAADVALIAATTKLPIQPVSIENGEYTPNRAGKVFSLGCDHGNPVTVRRGRYLNSSMIGPAVETQSALNAVETKDMVLKYDITGRPATGRSGGGLFSADGKLIGVCNAAMIRQDKGVYSSIRNVHQLLNETNLASLFRRPSVSPFGLENTRLAMSQRTSEAAKGRFRPVSSGPSFQIPSDGTFLARHLQFGQKSTGTNRSPIAVAQLPGSRQLNSPTRSSVIRAQSR